MMRNYSRPSEDHLETNGLYRGAYFSSPAKSPLPMRIGVPLIIAALSALGWYAASASKTDSTTNNAAQEELSPQRADVTPSGVDATTSIDASLEMTQSDAIEPMVETKLKVNSEPVPIPDNGSIHKVIQDGATTTIVDVTVDSQTNGSSEKNTSMNLEINSSSQVDSESSTKEGP